MFASRTRWSLTPNRLSEEIRECRQRGLALLDLTESNPTHCGFVVVGERVLSALVDARSLTYQPDPRGLITARQAVASYYAEHGVPVDPERVFLTTSTSEAYTYIFRLLLDPGDSLLVPQPSYPLFDFLASLNDVEIVPYPLIYDDGWQIDLSAIEAGLKPRTRAVVVVHPNNPTGSFVRKRELDFLLKCCRGHGLALIADEVFADYAFAPDALRVASHVGVTEALTFTLSGLSKISAFPQMKLAWVVVNGPPKLLREAMARLEVIADTYLSVSAPLACALPKWLELRRWIQPQILERVLGNLRWLDDRLTSQPPVSRLQVDGGWYVTLKLPATRSDEDWALDLVRQDGIIVYPGHFFDIPTEGHLVISLLTPSENFGEGVRKIIARVSPGN